MFPTEEEGLQRYRGGEHAIVLSEKCDLTCGVRVKAMYVREGGELGYPTELPEKGLSPSLLSREEIYRLESGGPLPCSASNCEVLGK